MLTDKKTELLIEYHKSLSTVFLDLLGLPLPRLSGVSASVFLVPSAAWVEEVEDLRDVDEDLLMPGGIFSRMLLTSTMGFFCLVNLFCSFSPFSTIIDSFTLTTFPFFKSSSTTLEIIYRSFSLRRKFEIWHRRPFSCFNSIW